jgi:hypothetical protein
VSLRRLGDDWGLGVDCDLIEMGGGDDYGKFELVEPLNAEQEKGNQIPSGTKSGIFFSKWSNESKQSFH